MKKILSLLLSSLLFYNIGCTFSSKKKATLSSHSDVMDKNWNLDSTLTADEILYRHFDSIGGPAVIKNIKTNYMEEMSINGEDTAVSQIWSIVNKTSKRIVNIKGHKIVQYFSVDKGYILTENGEQFNINKTPFYFRTNIFDCYYYQSPNFILNVLSSGYQFQRIDSCKGKYYRVSYPSIDSTAELILSIDPKTFRVVESQFGKIDASVKEMISYENFTKNTDGYVYPQSATIIKFNNGGIPIAGSEIRYSNIKININIDKSIFPPEETFTQVMQQENTLK